jgi:hypothetical protein
MSIVPLPQNAKLSLIGGDNWPIGADGLIEFVRYCTDLTKVQGVSRG